MLSNAKEKLIKSLHTKKGRQKHGLCLVEGEKVVKMAAEFVDFTFSRDDSDNFDSLVSTETPQDVAAVARIPKWSMNDIKSTETVIVLDGVQDPGNVGAILRLCLGFNASLLLIDSADVTNPKVVRSSVGALFKTPWMKVVRKDAEHILSKLSRPIYRLERTGKQKFITSLPAQEPITLIAGSEGNGISLPVAGSSVAIPHEDALESLNVGNAVAIALYERYK